ncbi:type VII secretion system-associated protein [Streptomyces sp. AC627_RSS907]|uniref:type VII secretion system-associated protein n=1 Tax=Streptomyces sp. AC627_RSS907 TaxID=2823684 RepID=UPI001C27817F|nr:type VII secretion system-associated protein [Streptomyces sp. AC627_RSS907]
MAKTTVLDSDFLNQFIKNHIEEFANDLAKIMKDDANGNAITYIAEGKLTPGTLASTKPLAIGRMAGDSSGVAGASLNKAIQALAEGISKVIKDHQVLFGDIEQALRDTITEMKQEQQASLEKMSATRFTDIFEPVQGDLSEQSQAAASTTGAGTKSS